MQATRPSSPAERCLRTIWANRLPFLAIVALGVVAAAAITTAQPTLYRSEALLSVKPPPEIVSEAIRTKRPYLGPDGHIYDANDPERQTGPGHYAPRLVAPGLVTAAARDAGILDADAALDDQRAAQWASAERVEGADLIRLSVWQPTPDPAQNVVGAALAAWLFRRQDAPPSPATFFLALYWGVAAACTLIGIAALTTEPLTGVLHVGRLIEYGLLYFLFYSSIAPEELESFVTVVRTSLLLVFAIWVGQHWTHVPGGAENPWATLYPTFSATYDFGGYVMLSTVLLYALWTAGADRSLLTTNALAAGAYLTVNSESRASLLGLTAVVAIDVLLRARWWAALGMAALAAAAPYLVTSKKRLSLISGVRALVTTFNLDVIRPAVAEDLSV